MTKLSNLLPMTPLIPALFSASLPSIQRADYSKPQPPPELTTITHIAPTPKDTEASYYDLRGRTTANGQIMDPKAMSCAHKTLPFGTIIKITRRDTGETTHIIVNDRGPFVKGRDLDLSLAAADKLSMLGADGVAPVTYEVVGRTKNFAKFGAGIRSREEILADVPLRESIIL